MSQRITAAGIASALGGRRSGRDYIARCPAHDDRTPSLSIADAADGADDSIVLVKCHAGCSQRDVIAKLKELGLWNPRTRARSTRQVTQIERRNDSGFARAMEIWNESLPANGSIVSLYLSLRGITTALPKSIRFHPDLRHAPSRTTWPGLIGLITRGLDNEPIGITRTYLSLDGTKASIEPNKMMLGRARGGAVHLAEASESLLIGEGIETCLSVLQATGEPVWAALSTSGLAAVEVPDAIRSITILADGDVAGERAAQIAARRFISVGRTVRIVRAPPGCDFNDVLQQ